MNRLFFIGILLCFTAILSDAQTYRATIEIGEIDIRTKRPGDDVIVPVKLVEKSGGLVSAMQLFIGFDHSKFKWKGTAENPLPGIHNLNAAMPYIPNVWIFNDNGSQMAASWIDPNLTGIGIEDGSIIVEYIFTYEGGMKEGEESLLIWGDAFEIADGKATKGATEMTSELIDNFELTMINGTFKK